MNFDEYEKKHEAIYAEFASVIRVILDKAIAASSGLPLPQSCQCRAKSAEKLKPKLQARGLLNSDRIEEELRDLAGARLIFYTNTDVDRFLQSRIIFENFEVADDGAKIHHPTPENAGRRYRAIHYTVTLNEARTSLPEYQKFAGMRCEIQIQTILNHAWSETSHDILYKPPPTGGFGKAAMRAIEKRMTRIMDDYLLPAGYEFQKVQHDFERLMQGKTLFDRGVIEALENCGDNNDRHEILSGIKEYVLPNYDDIKAIYPELLRGLVKAFDDSRGVENKAIETPFGNLPGKSPESITALIVDILNNLRYVDAESTFRTLIHIYRHEEDSDQRKNVLEAVKLLTQYNLQVWRHVGPALQLELTQVVEAMPLSERLEARPIFLTLWQEFLNAGLRGTTFSADAVTISTGAVKVSDDLATIREKALSGLFEFFDHAQSQADKFAVLDRLWEATRLPTQAAYSIELCGLVLRDTTRIVDWLVERIPGQSYQLLADVESNVHRLFQRSREIASAEGDRFGCKDLAERLIGSIETFRALANSDQTFVRYKTLVGFNSVFDVAWDDENFDYLETEEYRQAKVREYVDAVTPETENEWYDLLEACAATKSNDLATFPTFIDFVLQFSALQPAMAETFLARASDDLLGFLAGFLTGIFNSGDGKIYQRVANRYLWEGKHLVALAQHWRKSPAAAQPFLPDLLAKAIAANDHVAVAQCIAMVVEGHGTDTQPALDEFFAPAVRYLTQSKDTRWVRPVWFLLQIEPFFAELSEQLTDLILENLQNAPKIDHETERVLTCIAGHHGEAVWGLFEYRLSADRGDDDPSAYEPIPYRFDGLQAPLSQDVGLAVDAMRRGYRPDDPLFRFKGAQLLSIVFPGFPDAFAERLSQGVVEGNDDDIGFTLDVLNRYHGEPVVHPVLKMLVVNLPEADPRLEKIEMCLENTGVVSGQFGFADAFRRKKTEVEPWLADAEPKVRAFAERFIVRLDRRITFEQRSAEERGEMRRRHYDEGEEET